MGAGIEKKNILQMLDKMIEKLEGAEAALQVSQSTAREELCTLQLNKIAEYEEGFTKLENLMVKLPVIDSEATLITSDRQRLKLTSGF